VNDEIRQRLRVHFAGVQLTLLSVVVALILENLLGAYRDRPQPFDAAVDAWLFWLQASLILASAVSMWAGFALSLSISSRRPTPVDFIAPFGLLIAMNLAIGAMNPPLPGSFLVAAGAASLLASGIVYLDYRWAGTRGTDGPFAAFVLQFGLAGWTFAAAALYGIGWLGKPGVSVAVALCAVIQLGGFWGSMHQWRAST
jgi:hypothetical protein